MTKDTLLYRQVNPNWMQNGEPSSQTFSPTPKDEKKLSVYDGNQINAEDSWKHFTNTLGLSSIGTLSIAVEECTSESLPTIPDPQTFQEHALVDFSAFSPNKIKSKAKKLKQKALDRGWQYKA
jgi:hypothetical protein